MDSTLATSVITNKHYYGVIFILKQKLLAYKNGELNMLQGYTFWLLWSFSIMVSTVIHLFENVNISFL